MGEGHSEPVGLRERAREAMRQQIAETAMDLFAEQGFAATTVDDIVRRAGMSRRSFFRYFRSKEDVVADTLSDRGGEVLTALRMRPAEESARTALRAALQSCVARSERDPEKSLRVTRMLLENPALRGTHLEKQAAWQALLAPAVRERLATEPGDASDAECCLDVRAEALAGSAMACLDVAFTVWARSAGTAPLERLLDTALGILMTI